MDELPPEVRKLLDVLNHMLALRPDVSVGVDDEGHLQVIFEDEREAA